MRLLFILCAAFLGAAPLLTRAATVSGDLIKASGDTVYYFGADRKRYVFPTPKTYATWYEDFSGVKRISDDELASYPIGGNVTYRPGMRMVKITTDPKVYAVTRGGILRWIQTESVAAAVYGEHWARQIDDVPDAYFTNYRIGTPVASASDFSPSAEREAAATVNIDKNLATPSPVPVPAPAPAPAPAPSGPVYFGTIGVSNAHPRLGTSIQLFAEASPRSELTDIRLFFDDVLQFSCMQSPCSSNYAVPFSSAKDSFVARADFAWISGQRFSATTTVDVDTSTSSIVLLTVERPEVKPNRYASFFIDVSDNIRAVSIDVYADGVRVAQGCTDVQRCTLGYQDPGPAGVSRSAYAIVHDGRGFIHQSAVKNYQVVANDHPQMTVGVGKTLLQRNESVDVTVTASDDDVLAWTEIWMDGSLLKRCQNPSCSVQAGPWSQARTFEFIGKAADAFGLESQAPSKTVKIL